MRASSTGQVGGKEQKEAAELKKGIIRSVVWGVDHFKTFFKGERFCVHACINICVCEKFKRDRFRLDT